MGSLAGDRLGIGSLGTLAGRWPKDLRSRRQSGHCRQMWRSRRTHRSIFAAQMAILVEIPRNGPLAGEVPDDLRSGSRIPSAVGVRPKVHPSHALELLCDRRVSWHRSAAQSIHSLHRSRKAGPGRFLVCVDGLGIEIEGARAAGTWNRQYVSGPSARAGCAVTTRCITEPSTISMAQSNGLGQRGHERADALLRGGPGRAKRSLDTAHDDGSLGSMRPCPHGRSGALCAVVSRFDRVIRAFARQAAHCDACSS